MRRSLNWRFSRRHLTHLCCDHVKWTMYQRKRYRPIVLHILFFTLGDSWRHLGQFDRPEGTSITKMNGYWRLLPSVTYSVLNYHFVAWIFLGIRSVGSIEIASGVQVGSPRAWRLLWRILALVWPEIESSDDLKSDKICKRVHHRFPSLKMAGNKIEVCASAVDAISPQLSGLFGFEAKYSETMG